MSRPRMRRLGRIAAALSFCLLFFAVASAAAQDHRQGIAGEFDFYVLSLSWSPSYCEAAEERSARRPRDGQCSGRPFAFVIHGLWPQYERGFPSYCQVPSPRLSRAIVEEMLDLMPSPALVFHEWDRHGTCSGLSPRTYFDLVRAARAAIRIPQDYIHVDRPINVTPVEVVDAFLKTNPQLMRDAVNVSCDSTRLTEIRICMNKDLTFRGCPGLARHACRRDKIMMPAMRGR